MRSNRKNNRLSSVGMLSLMLVAGLALSGCYIELDEEVFDDGTTYSYLANMRVDWSIHGSSSASLCSMYGIDTWRIEVRGPESRTVDLDCRADFWSSENDLLAIEEGTYTVRVRALDDWGYQLAVLSTSLYLHDDGYVENLAFEFDVSDFVY